MHTFNLAVPKEHTSHCNGPEIVQVILSHMLHIPGVSHNKCPVECSHRLTHPYMTVSVVSGAEAA